MVYVNSASFMTIGYIVNSRHLHDLQSNNTFRAELLISQQVNVLFQTKQCTFFIFRLLTLHCVNQKTIKSGI